MQVLCRFKEKGQVALEYLIIISFALLLAAPIIFNAQSSTINLSAASRSAMAKNALKTVKESAELVYSQGEPARISFNVALPAGINSSIVNKSELSYTLEKGGDLFKVYEIVDFNLTGGLPIKPGTHKIITIAEEDYVNITY